MVAALVRFAVDAMAVGRLERVLGTATPRGGLADVQAVLSLEAESEHVWRAFRGERAGWHDLFTQFRSGQLPFSAFTDVWGKGGQPEVLRRWYAVRLPADHAAVVDLLTNLLAIRELPEHERRRAFDAVPRPALDPMLYGAFVEMETAALTTLHESDLRLRAQLRCAATAVAIERFRQATGRWPGSLADIPKDILPAVPNDPFDGKPLRYARHPDGVLVYSIGLDEEDNGGRVLDDLGLRGNGTDLVFRLYDPDKRGLPPEPRPDPDEPAPATQFGPEPRELGPE
jgi:hypothetical protein